MLFTIVILLVIYTAGCVFLNYQVWNLRKQLRSPAWSWVIGAFTLMLVNLCWVNVEFAIRIVLGHIPPLTVTLAMTLRLVRGFVFAYAGLACFILGFHKLHKSFEHLRDITGGE